MIKPYGAVWFGKNQTQTIPILADYRGEGITCRVIIGGHMLFGWYNFHALLGQPQFSLSYLGLLKASWCVASCLREKTEVFYCSVFPFVGFDYVWNELISWIEPAGTTQHNYSCTTVQYLQRKPLCSPSWDKECVILPSPVPFCATTAFSIHLQHLFFALTLMPHLRPK